MTVTELTLLRLGPGKSLSEPSLRSNLVQAKKAMEKYSNELSQNVSGNFPPSNPTHIEIPPSPTEDIPSPKFHIYSQYEDPTLVYILGSWPSTNLHISSFLPSPEFASVTKLLSPHLTQTSTIHIELPQLDHIPLDAPVLAIRRHTIHPADNASFEEAFEANKQHLEHFSARRLAGGWQVEKEERPDGGENDVFVLFSGWDDVEAHGAFGESERGKEYEKVLEWIEEGGLEVRHAVRVELDE